MIVTNKCIEGIIKKKKSSSEPIEPISNINTVCHGGDYKNEEWYIKISEIDIWKKWNTDSCLLEFKIKPEGSKCAKEKNQNELHSRRESFGPSDLSYIEIIIDEADGSNREEREKCEIGFISIPERVPNIDAELWSKIL